MNFRRFQIDLRPIGRFGRYCVGLGVVLSVYGCYRLYLTLTLLETGRRAEALVTHMDHRLRSVDEPIEPWHKEGRYSTWAYRTVVFTDATGRRIVDQPFVSWHHIHRDGLIYPSVVPQACTATVLYDPADPARWVFDDLWSLWGLPLLAVGGGLGVLSFTAVYLAGWIRPVRFRLAVRVGGASPDGVGG